MVNFKFTWIELAIESIFCPRRGDDIDMACNSWWDTQLVTFVGENIPAPITRFSDHKFHEVFCNKRNLFALCV